MKEKEDTARQILDVAQQMVQSRGYNAFSYADISAAVGIRKASIHYHFPNKSDLGKELVAHYRETFSQKLSQIDRTTNDPRHKIERYTQLYLEGLEDERMCLCGMLAADFTTLPKEVCEEVKRFFIDNEAWLTTAITEGCKSGVLHCNDSVEIEAQLLLSGLQGAQLAARSCGDLKRFYSIAQRLLSGLTMKP